MHDTEAPHETEVIALRRVIAEKHPTATSTQVHEHEGQFIGITFRVTARTLQYFRWADPTGAMPDSPATPAITPPPSSWPVPSAPPSASPRRPMDARR